MNGHGYDSLKRTIVIRTPENLEVSYELAGAGTRAAAYVLDLMVMFLLLSVFQNLIAAFLIPFAEDIQGYLIAVFGVITFAYFNGYFILFDMLWAGQSPGKRIVGIRVVKTGGYALRFPDTLVRNLLRAVDFIPLFYGVGLVTLLLTRHCQRIGDIVAGTLVVYQEKGEADSVFSSPAANSTITLPFAKLGLIPTDVVETCDEFLRIKDRLAPKYRQQFANDLLDLIEKLSGLFPAANQSAETFLLSVVSQSGQSPAMT